MNVFFIYFGHVQLLFPTLPPSVVSPPPLALDLGPPPFFHLTSSSFTRIRSGSQGKIYSRILF